MFGKSAWFRPKRWGWGLTPITWQGWLYALIWCGVLAIPMLALIVRHRIPEALLWQVAGMTLLIWDVKQILACYRTPPSSEPAISSDERSAERDASTIDQNSEIELLDGQRPLAQAEWFSRHFHFCLRR